MINKAYDISKLSDCGRNKKSYKVWAYKIDGDVMRIVRVVRGVKTAKAENFLLSEFQTGLRLGSVVEAAQ